LLKSCEEVEWAAWSAVRCRFLNFLRAGFFAGEGWVPNKREEGAGEQFRKFRNLHLTEKAGVPN
jgi:hypothetical protein